MLNEDDWINYAAEEIAARWSFGRGPDDYVTPEQREAVRQWIRDVITKWKSLK